MSDLNVRGVVEVIMTNKYNQDKYAMKIEGDDTWYGQPKEWLENPPRKGDLVEFYRGKTKEGDPAKYIQNLQILESSTKETAAPAKSGGGFNSLGVELGHAANNAVQLAVANGITDLPRIKQLTKEFYEMMKSLRSEYEGTQVVQEKAPKASAVKAKAKPKKEIVEDDPDDDIPF